MQQSRVYSTADRVGREGEKLAEQRRGGHSGAATSAATENALLWTRSLPSTACWTPLFCCCRCPTGLITVLVRSEFCWLWSLLNGVPFGVRRAAAACRSVWCSCEPVRSLTWRRFRTAKVRRRSADAAQLIVLHFPSPAATIFCSVYLLSLSLF